MRKFSAFFLLLLVIIFTAIFTYQREPSQGRKRSEAKTVFAFISNELSSKPDDYKLGVFTYANDNPDFKNVSFPTKVIQLNYNMTLREVCSRELPIMIIIISNSEIMILKGLNSDTKFFRCEEAGGLTQSDLHK